MKKLFVIGTVLMFAAFSTLAFADSNTGMMGAGGQNYNASGESNGANLQESGNYGYGMMGPGYGYGRMGRGYGYGMMGPGYGYGMMGPGYGHGMMGPGYGYGRMGRGYGYGMMGPGYGYGMMGPGYGHGYHHGYGYAGNLSQADLEKINKAREDFFKNTQSLREKIFETRSALYGELAQKEPNPEKVTTLQKELSSQVSDFAQKRIDYQLKLRKLLPEWNGFRGGYAYGPGYGGACW